MKIKTIIIMFLMLITYQNITPSESHNLNTATKELSLELLRIKLENFLNNLKILIKNNPKTATTIILTPAIIILLIYEWKEYQDELDNSIFLSQEDFLDNKIFLSQEDFNNIRNIIYLSNNNFFSYQAISNEEIVVKMNNFYSEMHFIDENEYKRKADHISLDKENKVKDVEDKKTFRDIILILALIEYLFELIKAEHDINYNRLNPIYYDLYIELINYLEQDLTKKIKSEFKKNKNLKKIVDLMKKKYFYYCINNNNFFLLYNILHNKESLIFNLNEALMLPRNSDEGYANSKFKFLLNPESNSYKVISDINRIKDLHKARYGYRYEKIIHATNRYIQDEVYHEIDQAQTTEDKIKTIVNNLNKWENYLPLNNIIKQHIINQPNSRFWNMLKTQEFDN